MNNVTNTYMITTHPHLTERAKKRPAMLQWDEGIAK